jgi:hypothetical protein
MLVLLHETIYPGISLEADEMPVFLDLPRGFHWNDILYTV